jgi:hypothetical protein
MLAEPDMAKLQNQPIFREVQKWSTGIRLVFLSLLLTVDAGIVVAILTTKRTPSDTVSLLLSTGLAVVVSLAVAVLLWINRLEIEVRPEGIAVRFCPFHRDWRRFSAQELSECYARRYRPLLEYGGWGIRYGWHGRAYNMSGHEGVQLVFQDGRRLLIGSKQPRQLEAAIRSVMNGNPVEPAGVRR